MASLISPRTYHPSEVWLCQPPGRDLLASAAEHLAAADAALYVTSASQPAIMVHI